METTKETIEACLADSGFKRQVGMFTRDRIRFKCDDDRLRAYRFLEGNWNETWSLAYEDIHFQSFNRLVRPKKPEDEEDETVENNG